MKYSFYCMSGKFITQNFNAVLPSNQYTKIEPYYWLYFPLRDLVDEVGTTMKGLDGGVYIPDFSINRAEIAEIVTL
jgi:hypothetical protein